MRSAWFAAYFSYGEIFCRHEAIRHDLDLDGALHAGTADCGYLVCPAWVKTQGEHKLVVIHRDVHEVAKSIAQLGLPDTIGYLPELAKQLYVLDGLHIDFDDIDMRLYEIHEYLGLPGYDEGRAKLFINMNIQAKEWNK